MDTTRRRGAPVPRATTGLATTAALLVLAAGCAAGGRPEPTAAPTTRTTTRAPVAPAPASRPTPQPPAAPGASTPGPAPATSEAVPGEPTFGEDTSAVSERRREGRYDLVFTGVRAARHPGLDRIVLELLGTGRPGWAVNYVDKPRAEGSGEPVPLDGDTFLDIYVAGTTFGTPDDYTGPRQIDPQNGGDVVELRVVGTAEGATQVIAGIDGDRAPFRVFALRDPARLVVDVQRRGR